MISINSDVSKNTEPKYRVYHTDAVNALSHFRIQDSMIFHNNKTNCYRYGVMLMGVMAR